MQLHNLKCNFESMFLYLQMLRIIETNWVTFSFTNAMVKMEEDSSTQINTEEWCTYKGNPHEESNDQLLKQQVLVDRQQKDIKVMSLYCSRVKSLSLSTRLYNH